MKNKIRVAILGYGNLGRGVELALRLCEDMELVAFFTRRDPRDLKTLSPDIPVYSVNDTISMKNDIDVMILCGGSAKDLPTQSPEFAKHFNIIDSFDTHAKIPEHFENCDNSSKSGGKISVISAGWDPGMFSLMRLFGEAILPCGKTYTFWGKGISQGHSDAIRRIDGVLDAKQYTIPCEEALLKVRGGEDPELSTREKHKRECFVVVAPDADKSRIENEIKNMPNYFADYDTTVHFISKEELVRDHSGIPHGGFVLRSGKTGENSETRHMIEYSLHLGSNPEFTSSVLVACARAAYRMNSEGACGAKTIFDIPPSYFSQKSGEKLRRELL